MDNPAIHRHTAIPPRLVEEAAADPRALEKVARAMAAVNLHHLFAKVLEQETGVSARLQMQQLLNRMGRIDAVEGAGGPNMPIVQISIGANGVQVSAAAPLPQPAEVVDVESKQLPNEPAPFDIKPIPDLGAKPLSRDDIDKLAGSL